MIGEGLDANEPRVAARSAQRREWRPSPTTLAVLALAAGAVARLPTLGQPLLEAHAWRQTATAFPALYYRDSGIDLLHPRLPILGPPYEAPFEFPLFQAAASLLMRAGLEPDPALRASGLFFFLLTGALLFQLARHVSGERLALAALLLFLFSPHALLWARTSMIEYVATAGAVGYVLFGIRWRERARPADLALALVTGAVGMLVKAPSALFWTLPLIAYRAKGEPAGVRGWWAARLRLDLAILVFTPLAIGVLWTRYADVARASAEGTAFLALSQLGEEWFGTFAERLEPAASGEVTHRIAVFLLGTGLALLLPVGALIALRSAQRTFWVAVVLAAALPVLTFFRLHGEHDYYQIAIAPAVAAVAAHGAVLALERRSFALATLAIGLAATLLALLLGVRREPSVATASAAGTLVAVAAAWSWDAARRSGRRVLPAVALTTGAVLSLVPTHWYWGRAYEPLVDPLGTLPRAEELARLSRPADRVVVLGHEWSPDLLYYARREGLMLPVQLLGAPFLARLSEGDYRYLVSWDPERDPLWVARAWPWVGALGRHTYALGTSHAELADAQLAASDDLVAFETAARTGRPLIDAPLEVRCGEGVALRSRGDLWLRLGSVPRDARVRASPELAPVPARAVVVVRGALARGDVRVDCAGAPALRVVAAVDSS